MIEHNNCEDLLAFFSDFVNGDASSELCQEINNNLYNFSRSFYFREYLAKNN
jgi:hypothetical protein